MWSSELDASDASNSYTLLDESGAQMERKRKGKTDNKFFESLGRRVSALIAEKGYKSPYAFWLEHGDEGLSRSNLNYLLSGKTDPKVSTLRRIAEGLEIDLHELFKGL